MERKAVIEIYTEYTPNPESLKFVANQMFLPGKSADFRNAESAGGSPLAKELFGHAYVNGVFIANNFVTITKDPGYQWHHIIPDIKKALKEFILSGEHAVAASNNGENAAAKTGAGPELENRIIELLDTYVKPAVEQDGGAIQFKSFQDGIVTLILQGSCSGCPSSILTLKAGIEGMLKRMIPEVKEVVAEEQ